MSLLFFEGFQTIGTTFGQPSSAPIITDLQKRVAVNFTLPGTRPYLFDRGDGDYALAFKSNGTFIQTLAPPGYASDSVDAGPTTVIGFAWKSRSTTSNTENIFESREGSTDQLFAGQGMQVRVTDSDTITIHRGGGSALATAAGVITTNTWHYIEIKMFVANSGGIFQVRVDGTQVINFSGDTRVSNITYAPTAFRFGLNATSTTTTLTDGEFPIFDDIYILDITGAVNNDFLGVSMKVISLPPLSDSTAEWTPSTGSDNYALVDENPNDSADYVEASAAAIDEYEVPNAAVSIVAGIKIEAEAFTTVAGSPVLHTRINSNNELAEAAHTVDNLTAEVFTQYAEINPDGGGAWSQAPFNNVLAGMRYAAS